jgi:hypothetical protein
LSPGTPASGSIATAEPVVSAVSTPITLEGPPHGFRGHKSRVTTHFAPLRWENVVRELDSPHRTPSDDLAQASSR